MSAETERKRSAESDHLIHEEPTKRGGGGRSNEGDASRNRWNSSKRKGGGREQLKQAITKEW